MPSRLEANTSRHNNKMHSGHHTPQSPPLLLLPAELRNTIYTYALAGHDIFIWNHTHANHFARRGQRGPRFLPPNLLALLSVCRQIYAETRLLPFKLNTFVGHAPSSDDFLAGKIIDQARLDVVRELRWSFFILAGLEDEWTKSSFQESFEKVIGLMSKLRGLERVVLEVKVRFVKVLDVESLFKRLVVEANEILGGRGEERKVQVDVVAR